MNNTPQRVVVVLAAGEAKRIGVPGNWMQVMACTVANFEFAFDNDPFTAGEPFVSYPAKDGFKAVRFRDSLGAGCTIQVDIADTLPQDNRHNRDELVAIHGHLASIDLDTDSMDSHLHDIEAHIGDAEVHLGNIETVLNPSTDGESSHIDLTASGGADPHVTLPSQACHEVQFHTAGSSVYVRLKSGAVDADNTRELLVADMVYTWPVVNCDLLHFYNDDAANAAIVWYTWRN